MELFGYRKLIVYKKSKELVRQTYLLLTKFPSIEKHAMCNQLRRASISITSNIAEGVNRSSAKEKVHFIEVSFASLMEVSSQFEIAEELGYITTEERISIDKLIEEIARLLSGLRKSYQS